MLSIGMCLIWLQSMPGGGCSHCCHGYLFTMLDSLITLPFARHNPQVRSMTPSLIIIIHVLWTSTETTHLQRLNSRVGIFTFMVILATKTKLPVNKMQNTKSWIFLQSQEPRFSQLFYLVPCLRHHVCSSITLISCWHPLQFFKTLVDTLVLPL